jgi:3'-phosphoadenosine 5'-phosphosulfate sulfotransferase (PAPS reductase)/FAD synthetase
MNRPLHVVLVSGGKDSAAVATLALARVSADRIRLVFCDTGNEHPETYAYLDRLEAHFGLPIHRVKADYALEIQARRLAIARDNRVGRGKDGKKKRWSNRRKREALSVMRPTGNPFLDLCLIYGAFPSRTVRFCTRRLKIETVNEFLLELREQAPLIVWQGVKRADSAERSQLRQYERFAPGWFLFRPILDWSHDQVFAYLRETGTPVNPLYGTGFSRVGCGPCLYARKSEITLLAEQYSEQIDRIREWERLVSLASKDGFAAFFGHRDIPTTPRTVRARTAIDGVVKWARVDFRKNKQATYEEVFGETCSAGQGMCE